MWLRLSKQTINSSGVTFIKPLGPHLIPLASDRTFLGRPAPVYLLRGGSGFASSSSASREQGLRSGISSRVRRIQLYSLTLPPQALLAWPGLRWRGQAADVSWRGRRGSRSGARAALGLDDRIRAQERIEGLVIICRRDQ